MRLEHLIDEEEDHWRGEFAQENWIFGALTLSVTLPEFADGYTSEWLVPDLDHDGVPEIISIGYLGPTPCGEENGIHVAWWNGTRYRTDKRHYVALAGNGRGYQMRLSASKHYVVHVYGKGRALLDDEPVTPGKVFTTEDDCHTFAVKGSTSAWAFLEERP